MNFVSSRKTDRRPRFELIQNEKVYLSNELRHNRRFSSSGAAKNERNVARPVERNKFLGELVDLLAREKRSSQIDALNSVIDDFVEKLVRRVLSNFSFVKFDLRSDRIEEIVEKLGKIFVSRLFVVPENLKKNLDEIFVSKKPGQIRRDERRFLDLE